MALADVRIEAQLLLYILLQPACNFADPLHIHDITCNAQIDSEKFVALAIKNGLECLIYLRVKDSTFLPAVITEQLKLRYRRVALRNLGLLAELLQVLDIFYEHRIDIVPLKGVADAEILFGDLGSYPSSDIDLLVPEKELSVLCAILNQHGYFAIESISEDDLLSSHYHLIYRKTSTCLELHWNLVKRYFKISSDFWWEETHKRTLKGREITELAAEKYLLYLIFRLFDHQFSPLKFWVHFSAFITNTKQLNWDKLIYYSDLFGMKRLVWFSLQFVNEHFGTQMPTEIDKNKVWGYAFLRKLVLKQNFGDNLKPHLAMLCFSCFLLPPSTLVRVVFLRIFTTKAEVRLRYGLTPHSKAVYLYMIFNPLLMLLKRK